MSLISKETLLTHLQRAEMASDVRLPIEFFRDLVYQAMPRTWVGLTDEEIFDVWLSETPAPDKVFYQKLCRSIEVKLRSKNDPHR
jgi:hypothetical protein